MTAKLLIAGFGYILHGVEKRLAVFAAVDSSIEHIVPCDVGIETVRFGLLFELSLERSQLLWILLSQINSLLSLIHILLHLWFQIDLQRRVESRIGLPKQLHHGKRPKPQAL